MTVTKFKYAVWALLCITVVSCETCEYQVWEKFYYGRVSGKVSVVKYKPYKGTIMCYRVDIAMHDSDEPFYIIFREYEKGYQHFAASDSVEKADSSFLFRIYKSNGDTAFFSADSFCNIYQKKHSGKPRKYEL